MTREPGHTRGSSETAKVEHRGGSIRIAISSCLLGEAVRYDGGHKHNGYITKTLGRYFEFVSVCPEAAVGLGIPRPPIRLVGLPAGVRARGAKDSALDPTDALSDYGRRMAARLSHVSGYILKKGSPSCGMERVKIYTEQGMPVDSGRGVYAAALMQALPLLPVEEEGRLMDPVLRENFIERVFIYHQWQQLADRLNAQDLVAFHTRHKFAVLAHDEQRYRKLGQLVATAGSADLEDVAQTYISELMAALQRPATRRRHSNVLMHIMGFLKQDLDAADKAELGEVIDAYRRGLVPLVVPITLLRHHLRRHPKPYISQQSYLTPHPEELLLRNSL